MTDELSIEKFDPTVDELMKLSESAKLVVVTDPTDKAQIARVTEVRKSLKAVRVRITNTGKEMREKATKFNRDVLAKERELIAIIEPDELRLSEIEAQIERAAEIERMKLLLPVRRARIAAISTQVMITHAELNAMSIEDFEAYILRLQTRINEDNAKKLADERAAFDQEKRDREAEDKRKADEERIRKEEREKAERDATEKVRLDAERIEREAKQKADKILSDARAAADEEARLARVKKDEDQRISDEAMMKKHREDQDKIQREKAQRFQAFLKGKGVSEENAKDHEQRHVGNTIQLWKKIGVYVVE